MDTMIAASLVGACNVVYLVFIVYVLVVSYRNNYKVDKYILATFIFIAISLGLWFAEYYRMTRQSPQDDEEELLSTYYLDPFFSSVSASFSTCAALSWSFLLSRTWVVTKEMLGSQG